MDSNSEDKTVPTIREADFYRAVLGSDKAAAHPFRHWLTTSVIPTIKADGVFLYGEDAEQRAPTSDLVTDLNPRHPKDEGVLPHLFDRVLPGKHLYGIRARARANEPALVDTETDAVQLSEAVAIYLRLKGKNRPDTFKPAAGRSDGYLKDICGNKSITG